MARHDPVTPALGQPVTRPRRRGPSPLVIVLSVLVAVALGVGVGALFAQRDGPGPEAGGDGTGGSAGEAQPIEPAAVSSFDPVGGSGFEDDGDGTWSTQTYTTAEFGNLKEGVGLLVDLGEPREVTTVAVDLTPGTEVQLLGGDEPPASDVSGYTPAESTTSGDGTTTLSGAEAGSHRYWLVWVTRLAAVSDGFVAEAGTPVVEGPPA